MKTLITDPFAANTAVIEEKHRLMVCPLKGSAVLVDPKQFVHFITSNFGKSTPQKWDGRAAPFSAASVTIECKGETAFFGAIHAFFCERFEHIVKLTSSYAAACKKKIRPNGRLDYLLKLIGMPLFRIYYVGN
jgi:hypothetical protein